MMDVRLVAETSMPPEQLASNAGRACYEAELPILAKAKIDVKKRLFKPGHHTTLEHSSFTFAIDDISVSTITFGLHLAHPFYNSDQRSGRYSKMYDNPDITEIKDRIKYYYPNEKTDDAMDMIKYGVDMFHDNKEMLANVATAVLYKERPNAGAKYIDQNAKKMAQEQLRVFISTVMPTGMYHTVDLVTLAALARVAWTPEMHMAADLMGLEVLKRHPEIDYVFGWKYFKPTGDYIDGNPTDPDVHFCGSPQGLGMEPRVKHSPELRIKSMDIPFGYTPTVPHANDSVDTLKFDPISMDGNLYSIRTEVEMSAMTMGQDQRHRTIGRGRPWLNGNFYMPPLPRLAGLEKKAEEFQKKWARLMVSQPHLANFVAPYGAVIRYQKHTDMNALLHEQEKRLCWCAQEEIYNLNALLAGELDRAGHTGLVNAMKPACAKTGKCAEGARYCGRDMDALDYFRQRRI